MLRWDDLRLSMGILSSELKFWRLIYFAVKPVKYSCREFGARAEEFTQGALSMIEMVIGQVDQDDAWQASRVNHLICEALLTSNQA